MKRSISGFTVVELLIVIVVMAMLAVITLVSYGGVQQKARNAKVVSGVKAYQKAIINYAARHGSYPTNYGACLGSGYPSNQCWTGPNGTFNVNAGFDTMIAPYLGSTKPVLANTPLQVTATDQRLGAIFIYNSATDVKIIYYLEGRDQKCIEGNTAANELQTTQCHMNLPKV